MGFCGNCGAEIQVAAKFCPHCGAPVGQPSPITPQEATPAKVEEEKVFYKGEGELIVKRTEHQGAGRKIASWYLGPVGYLAFGRDKTRKSTAKGTLVVTNKAIYCAGNDYPFDRILSITKQGTISKSILLTFEKGVGAGGRAEGGVLGVGGLSVEVELKTKDIDGLFKGLEQAKMAHIKF
jgi:hypothetical protein